MLVLLLMLVGVAVAVSAGAVLLMAWSIVRPPRMTDGRAAWILRRVTPGDLGLGFEPLRFDIRDEAGRPLSIAAWWVPHPDAGGKCAVLIHGYADAKVGAIAWAPAWYALGYNLLVPDLRAHGESGGSACTAGFFERHDVSAIMNELSRARPHDTRQWVLFGVSLGAAVAAATAAGREDVSAVVMDSPYADFRTATLGHMERLGAPALGLNRLAVNLAGWLTRADFSAVRPPELIPRLSCPVLVISNENDTVVPADDRRLLREAVERHRSRFPSDTWTVPDTQHLMALAADPQAYESRLRQFLRNAAPAVLKPA